MKNTFDSEVRLNSDKKQVGALNVFAFCRSHSRSRLSVINYCDNLKYLWGVCGDILHTNLIGTFFTHLKELEPKMFVNCNCCQLRTKIKSQVSSSYKDDIIKVFAFCQSIKMFCWVWSEERKEVRLPIATHDKQAVDIEAIN